MKDRCENENARAYVNYGARGIKVCDRWQEFANFLADMGERPKDMSLGRLDNEGNYKPGNCTWQTREEQNNNTRQNFFVTYRDETLTVAQWAKKLGVSRKALYFRLRNGWATNDAFEIPFDDLAEVRKHRQNSDTITYKGETLTYLQWERRTGIGRNVLKGRIERGWSAKEALIIPLRPQINRT